ncbi:MAG: FMN-binding protein [Verrucomicrobiota bacterium]
MPAQARTVWLRLYRGVILLLVLWLIRQQAHWLDQQLVSPVTLRQARKFLPTAERMQCRDPVRGLYSALNARGDAVGVLLTTSPFTDDIIGYSGPSDVLVALNRDGAIIGLEVLRSGDTPEYVRQVRANPGFLPKLLGWKSSEHSMPKVDAVSGATLTSLAMLESIQRRLLGSAPSLRFPEAIALAEVQTLFPNAAHLVSDQQRWRVVDGSGQSLGYVLRTSPQADNVAGYRGPTDCLIALDRDGGKVLGLDIRRSYDTGSYVDQVRRAGAFLKFFAARTVKELAELEMPKNTIDGISGATMTARAIVEGTRRRAAAEWRRPPATPWLKAHDWELAAVVAVALVFSFTSLRGHRWARVAWQIVLVGYVGLMHRDFLSLALIGGWAANGLALQAAPGLFLLAAASFMIPWATRRQVYCHHLCPHGAAQQQGPPAAASARLGAADLGPRETWTAPTGPPPPSQRWVPARGRSVAISSSCHSGCLLPPPSPSFCIEEPAWPRGNHSMPGPGGPPAPRP